MLTEICHYLKNWFVVDAATGTFSVVDGALASDDVSLSDYLQTGQYYCIDGSVFNDGVHVWDGTETLRTERAFNGKVLAMAVPDEVLSLAQEIETWVTDNAEIINSPYTSESFGGYSYTKESGSGGADGDALSWQSKFGSRLARWRKT